MVLADTPVESPDLPVGAPRPRSISSHLTRSRAFSAALLLATPFLLVWPLRAQLFAPPGMIDPYFHTAVIQHGRDLLERFGANNRQFARAGFVVPGRVTNAVFGDLGGYYAFRYLLVLVAIAPAFLLFRRLHGRAAGAVAVATIVASPVIVRAWTTDYADASAVSYLVAGYCCLVMPAAHRARIWWVTAASAFLCLAVHSNFVALPLVLGVLFVYTVSRRRAPLRELVREALAVIASAVVVSLALMLASWILFGHANIWRPTWDAFEILRTPEQVAVNHSSNWRWVLDAPHLLVPPLVALVWFLLSLRPRHGFQPAETVLWWTLSLQTLGFVVMQFALDEQVLEFHFYLSMLWPTTALVGASVVCECCRSLFDRPVLRWIPAATIFVVPLLLAPFRRDISMGLLAGALLLVGVVIVVRVLVVTASPVRRLAALVVFLAGSFVLVIGQSPDAPLRAGQAAFPKPFYGWVFANTDGTERDRYAVTSDLDEIVPTPPRRGVPLLMWVAPDWSQTPNVASAQYGWLPNVIVGLPTLTDADVARIRAVNPDVIVLLSDVRSNLSPAVADFRAAFPGSVARAPVELRHGGISLYVVVVELAV